MHPALIGITSYNSRNQYGYPISALMHRYSAAVIEAGGVPMLIPTSLADEALEAAAERLDGVLFSGGGDIAIQRFGGEPHAKIIEVDEARDANELALVAALVKRGKPFLGICRGFQLINVALGGTLFTHITDQLPGAIKHDYDSGTQRELLAHEVELTHGSHLAGISGEERLRVNSLHHQGAKDLAPGLVVSALAPDGLVEGFELPDHPFGIAVQWHPEWLTIHSNAQPHAQRLFQAFIKACE